MRKLRPGERPPVGYPPQTQRPSQAPRGHLVIGKHGIIVGGSCDRAHGRYRRQENGIRRIVDMAISQGKIKTVRRSWKILGPPALKQRPQELACDGDEEIGMYRGTQLLQDFAGKTVSKARFDKEILRCSTDYSESYSPGLYRRRRKDGEV